MAKQTGLGDKLFVGGYDLSGDVGSLGRIGGGPAAMPMTGIDKSAFERFGGLLDGGIEFAGFFNKAAGRSHPVLAALPRTDQVVTYLRGQALGSPAASLVTKQVNYDFTRGADGALSIAVSTQASAGYPLEWGLQATAGAATITGAASGTGLDLAASTAFGMTAYLHVSAFTGTDASVLIQASSDNAVGDPYAEPSGGLTFTQITAAPFSQRITTGAAVSIERYVRQAVVTTGGFSSMTYTVMIVKHTTAMGYM